MVRAIRSLVVVAVALLAVTEAAAQTPELTLQHRISPPVVSQYVFDSTARELLSVDTDGSVWVMGDRDWPVRPASLLSPHPVGNGMLLDDPFHRRVLMVQPRLVWSLEAGRWRPLNTTDAPRTRPLLGAVDRSSGRVFVVDQTGLLHVLDGSQWQVAGLVPLNPQFCVAAFDAQRGVFVIANTFTLEVAEWQGSAFVTHPGLSLPNIHVEYGAMVEDPAGAGVVLTGACHQIARWACLTWSGAGWTVAASIYLSLSGFRCFHFAYSDRVLGKIFFIGGLETIASGQPLTEISTWDGSTLRDERMLPVPIDVSYWCYDPRVRAVVAADDEDCEYICTVPTWQLDGVLGRWQRLSARAPNGQYACAFDANLGEVVAWTSAQLQGFNGTAWQPRGGSLPSAGLDVAMAFDPLRARLVLAHGPGTHLFDGTAWQTVTTATAPTRRSSAAMVFDPVRGVCVLHGGIVGTTWLADTWSWNGTAWQQLAVAPPSTLQYPSMVFDPGRQATLLLGETQGSELWRLDAAAWQLVERHNEPLSNLLWDDSRGRMLALRRAPLNRTVTGVVEWSGTVATARPFGSCLPTLPQLQAARRPRLGDPDFALEVAATPGQLVVFAVGTPQARAKTNPCPLLLSSVIATGSVLADARGVASVAPGLPFLGALFGLEVGCQAALLSTPTQGVEFSSALVLRLGD